MQSWWRRPNGTLATHPAAPAQVAGGVTAARVQNGPNVDRMTIRPVTVGGRRFIDVTIVRQNINGKPPVTLSYRFASGGRPDPNAVILVPTVVNSSPLTPSPASGANAFTGPAARDSIPFGAGDWDGDGHVDVVAATTKGDLVLYSGSGGRGPLSAPPVKIGNGWSPYSSFGIGDWDGDGKLDIVTRQNRTGDLMLYPGEGRRAYSSQQPVRIGNGWNGYTFFGMIDWDRDGKLDILARRDSTGELMLYPGEGTRAYSSQQPVRIATGWGGYSAYGAADWDRDGMADIMVRAANGDLLLFSGNGRKAELTEAPVKLAQGWGALTSFGIADWDGDGRADILARDTIGELLLIPGDGGRNEIKPGISRRLGTQF